MKTSLASEEILCEIDHVMQKVADYILSQRVASPQNTLKTYRKSCEGVCLCSILKLMCCGLPCTVFVVYSEEVVLVGEGLIFLEIVGGTCTVSLFPVLWAVGQDLLRASTAEEVFKYFVVKR